MYIGAVHTHTHTSVKFVHDFRWKMYFIASEKWAHVEHALCRRRNMPMQFNLMRTLHGNSIHTCWLRKTDISLHRKSRTCNFAVKCIMETQRTEFYIDLNKMEQTKKKYSWLCLSL